MPRGGHREGAGRKSAWKHRETTVIRVPKVFAEHLLEIAQRLDNGDKIEFVSKSKVKPIDIITESKKKNDLVIQSNSGQLELVTDSEDSLSGKGLARRLGIDPSTLRWHRKKGNSHLSKVSAQKDPDGKAWEYREDGKYYFVSSTL